MPKKHKSGSDKQITGPHRPVTNIAPPPLKVRSAKVHEWSLGSAGPRHAFHAKLESFPKLESAVAAQPKPPVVSVAHLPDIGEASFGKRAGEATLEQVIGDSDSRERVADTSAYPWRAIASLLIIAGDGSKWVGTGWFISERTLVTAGHCVFIRNADVPGRFGWVRSITVTPGLDNAKMPFPSVTSTEFKSVDGWIDRGSEEFDYGAIVLPSKLGDQVGTFGYGSFPDADLSSLEVNLSGYPSDKNNDPATAGTQWYDRRQVSELGARKVYYDIDTYEGQSGAPVWTVGPNGETTAVAIHAYGPGGGSASNSATRITKDVFDNLTLWRA